MSKRKAEIKKTEKSALAVLLAAKTHDELDEAAQLAIDGFEEVGQHYGESFDSISERFPDSPAALASEDGMVAMQERVAEIEDVVDGGLCEDDDMEEIRGRLRRAILGESE